MSLPAPIQLSKELGPPNDRRLSWTGGEPLFQVQYKNHITDGWKNYGEPTLVREMPILTDQDERYFRVASVAFVPWVVSFSATAFCQCLGVVIGGATNPIVPGFGNILVAGYFGGTLTIGNRTLTANGSSPDIFLVSLSGSGQVLWAKQISTGTSNEVPACIASDLNGNI